MAFTFSSTTGSVPYAHLSGSINVPNITVTGSTFNIPAHTASFTLGSHNTSTYIQATSVSFSGNYGVYTNRGSGKTYYPSFSGSVASSSGWTYTYYTFNASASSNINTSSIFNSNNSTSRTATITVDATFNYGNSINYGNVAGTISGTGTVTLNVPPTYDLSTLSIDTAYIYTGLTTASVTVSNLSAKYGGTITDVTFTIGNTSVSRSDAGTLSILLDTVGTFTPTVTVTDSRGQTTTKTLDPITVNGYVAPSVSFTADRTLASGVPDDEGTYATIDAALTFTDVVADAVAPSVVLTDENGTQTTPSVTWYTSRASDGTLSGALSDWSTLSSGDTVYGLIPNVNTQYSYQISVRPRDSQGTGTAITQTLPSAFYTVDFLAGGHGIAFGKPASDTGFECAMTALFEDDATFGADVLIDLPNYQTTGSVDKELYDAIVSLGWDSDVLIN